MKSAPIIMIHGFRGTHHGLSFIADNLKSNQLFIPDLPGFGEGPTLQHYQLDDYVDWLHQYIKGLKLTQKPILLGHSFGSIVCAAYAKRYQSDLDRLILVNPIASPALKGPRKILSQLAVVYYWLGKTLPESLGRAWLSSKPSVMVMSTVMAKTKDPSVRAMIHDQHLTYFSRFHSTASVYEAFKTSISWNVKDFAAAITLPTLLIAGTKDDMSTVADQESLAASFPHATLRLIDGVGHLTHYETPSVVASFVHDFIKD